ncbi:MAG: hypothetical protein FWG44_08980 [Oscillospiraceae bacterium]|nr:hypothetical protein [Oscillospiraceae bacterium]
MREFTHAQIERLHTAVTIYRLRRVEGLKWAIISRTTHYSRRQCFYLHAYAKRALERLHGFDNHSTYD